MGWNSWNYFGGKINETLIKQQADALLSTGLAAKGYIHVNLDDGWHVWRSGRKNGQMQVDAHKFPSGMKALGDYLHSKGLKFGIYGDSGVKMCSGASESGSAGHEVADAALFASWGVDYLKYDNCYVEGVNNEITSKHRYGAMRDALLKSGRPIFYSICNWNQFEPAYWPGRDWGNSWRTVGDIRPNFESVYGCAERNNKFANAAGPGGWNDPDMLEVGNGMTVAEDRAHFSLWAIMKSPLLIGTDILSLDKERMAIVGNEDLIAVNQDPLGEQAMRHEKTKMSEIWAGRLSGGKFGEAVVVLLFNTNNSTEQVIEAPYHHIGLSAKLSLYAKDLYKGTVSGPHVARIWAKVPPHDVAVFVLSTSKDMRTGKLFTSAHPTGGPPAPTAGTKPGTRAIKSSIAINMGHTDVSLLTRWTKVVEGYRIQYRVEVVTFGSSKCGKEDYRVENITFPFGSKSLSCAASRRPSGDPNFFFAKNWQPLAVFGSFPSSRIRRLESCSFVGGFHYHGTDSAPQVGDIYVALAIKEGGRYQTSYIRFHGYAVPCTV